MELEEKPPDTPENEQVYRIIKCPLKCVLKRYDGVSPIKIILSVCVVKLIMSFDTCNKSKNKYQSIFLFS